MDLLRAKGPRTRRLLAALRRRERLRLPGRTRFDGAVHAGLDRRRAIVYTDTADFTVLAARHGILHFLMVFARIVRRLAPVIRRHHGRIVKIEADSLMLAFADASAACRAVAAIDRALHRLDRGRPASERLRFSYGIGFGDVLDLEGDVFGLEVNLASKLGEDFARPGEVLLTPAAAAALPERERGRLSPHGRVGFVGRPMKVHRLPLERRRRRS